MGIRFAPFRACPPAANQQAEHALSLQQREMPQPPKRMGHLSSCHTRQERTRARAYAGTGVSVSVSVLVSVLVSVSVSSLTMRASVSSTLRLALSAAV